MQTQYKRLTDPQWEVIKDFLPIQRKRKYDLREIVNAIFWYLRIGSQWRNLPESFPKWQDRSSLKAVVGKFTTILGNGNRMAPWKDSTGV